MKSQNKRLITKAVAITIVIVLASVLVYFVFIKESTKTRKAQENVGGLLSINTDKSQYKPGEKVNIQITSLDKSGNTICNSNLQLNIIRSDNNEATEQLSSERINQSSSCDPDNNATFNPDYTAHFTPKTEGEYQLVLDNQDSDTTNQTNISVTAGLSDFSISRWGASKVNSSKSDRYPMKITITFNKDFEGKVVETIPQEFEIVWQGPATVESQKDHKTISWEVNLAKGETKELVYEYNPPQSGSKLYHLGGVTLITDNKTVYEETRQWQIVSNR